MTLNLRVAVKVLGILLIFLGAFMIPALFLALLNSEKTAVFAFAVSIISLTSIGAAGISIKAPSKQLHVKDGFLIVSSSWIFCSLAAALPYILSGVCASPADGIFEGFSGLTTTGATAFADIEILPKSILFWRAATEWIGGLGILVMTVSLFSELDIGGMQINRWGSLSIVTERLTLKLSPASKRLIAVYAAMTVTAMILLFFSGMNVFDSVCHGFTVVSTGGFSNYNDNIGHFQRPAVNLVIMIFSLLASLNFYFYLHLMKSRQKLLAKDSEFKFFILLMASATAIMTASLFLSGGLNFFPSLHHGLFQTVSAITTSGFFISDFHFVTTLCKVIILILIFTGGCSASTAGGLKSIRVLVLIKSVLRSLEIMIHPQGIIPVKLGSQPLSSETITSVMGFAALFIYAFLAGTLIVSFDFGNTATAFGVSAACLSNTGLVVGDLASPTCYAQLAIPTKVFLSLLMVAGRLELYAILLLFTPSFWRPSR